MSFRSGAALISTLILIALTSSGTLAASASPEVGTWAEAVDLSAVPGATPYGEGHAIPLRGDVPDWYTPELAARVDAANSEPVAAPEDAPLPSEVGIRPGTWMISPSGCTMNFIFKQAGAYAIGTAGHCVDALGQEVVLLTLAPGSKDPVLVEVGKVLKRHDNGIGDDFALVSIRPELQSQVSPTTALIGGPCGQYAGFGPETVAHVGHGLVIGTGGTPRAGVALTWFEESYGWDGAAIFGDSGSPVRVTDLEAAGNLTHLLVDDRFLPSFIAGTRIQKMLEIAGDYSLADSPLCPTVEDKSAPTVSSVTPTEEQQGVSRTNPNISATFSESMDEATVEASGTFTLKKKGSAKALSATVNYDPNTKTATLTPNSSLVRRSWYRVTVTTGATDQAGNALDQDANATGNQSKVWYFKTARR